MTKPWMQKLAIGCSVAFAIEWSLVSVFALASATATEGWLVPAFVACGFLVLAVLVSRLRFALSSAR